MPDKKIYIISLSTFLLILWLLLSGHYVLLLISLGVFSVLLVTAIVWRMDIVDHEAHPIHISLRFIMAYWVWLLKEIFVSSIYTCRLILNPAMPISPKWVVLRNSLSSDVMRVTLANSITLTPGTVSMNVGVDAIEVHAITEQAAQSLLEGSIITKVMTIERKSRG